MSTTTPFPPAPGALEALHPVEAARCVGWDEDGTSPILADECPVCERDVLAFEGALYEDHECYEPHVCPLVPLAAARRRHHHAL